MAAGVQWWQVCSGGRCAVVAGLQGRQVCSGGGCAMAAGVQWLQVYSGGRCAVVAVLMEFWKTCLKTHAVKGMNCTQKLTYLLHGAEFFDSSEQFLNQ
jgi:hypothetical protein